MSENIQNTTQPALTDAIQELQASFPNDAALQAAIGKLELAGFDHADLSLPNPTVSVDTPDSAEAATDNVDRVQLRTMASGMAGTAAGMIAAGVIVATGGLAAPVVAAVGGASALGTIALTSGANVANDSADAKARDELGTAGKLILAVRIRSAEWREKAMAVLEHSGATAITAIEDADQAKTRGTSAASWTG